MSSTARELAGLGEAVRDPRAADRRRPVPREHAAVRSGRLRESFVRPELRDRRFGAARDDARRRGGRGALLRLRHDRLRRLRHVRRARAEPTGAAASSPATTGSNPSCATATRAGTRRISPAVVTIVSSTIARASETAGTTAPRSRRTRCPGRRRSSRGHSSDLCTACAEPTARTPVRVEPSRPVPQPPVQSAHRPTRSSRWCSVRKPAARGLVDRDRDRTFDRGGRGEVFDAAAVRAHEVMMVAGEILGELVAREVGVGHEPVHDPRLLEHHEVPVGRALGELGPGVEDLGDRERPVGGLEHVDDEPARRREPLLLGCCSSAEIVSCSRVERGAFAAIACECTGTVGRSWTPRERFAAAVAAPAGGDASRRRRVLPRRARAPGSRHRRAAVLGSTTSPRGARPRRSTACARISSRRSASGATRATTAIPRTRSSTRCLERRLGIPISLAVVTMEVGRRIGAPVHGVGMPGHFLVMDAAREGVWCDPFHGGALYDIEGCRRLFSHVCTATHAASRARARAHRRRTSIVARMLANLETGRLASDPVRARMAVRAAPRAARIFPPTSASSSRRPRGARCAPVGTGGEESGTA